MEFPVARNARTTLRRTGAHLTSNPWNGNADVNSALVLTLMAGNSRSLAKTPSMWGELYRFENGQTRCKPVTKVDVERRSIPETRRSCLGRPASVAQATGFPLKMRAVLVCSIIDDDSE